MKRIIIISICLFEFITAFCQTVKPEIITTSGDFFVNANSSLSWSIGECITETFITTNAILTQGFQQSHYIITRIDDFASGAMIINVFPNPASDFIDVEIENRNNDQAYTLKLFDLQGRELFSNELNTNKSQLNLRQYIKGVYFLMILDRNNSFIRYYKIEKID